VSVEDDWREKQYAYHGITLLAHALRTELLVALDVRQSARADTAGDVSAGAAVVPACEHSEPDGTTEAELNALVDDPAHRSQRSSIGCVDINSTNHGGSLLEVHFEFSDVQHDWIVRIGFAGSALLVLRFEQRERHFHRTFDVMLLRRHSGSLIFFGELQETLGLRCEWSVGAVAQWTRLPTFECGQECTRGPLVQSLNFWLMNHVNGQIFHSPAYFIDLWPVLTASVCWR